MLLLRVNPLLLRTRPQTAHLATPGSFFFAQRLHVQCAPGVDTDVWATDTTEDVGDGRASPPREGRLGGVMVRGGTEA